MTGYHATCHHGAYRLTCADYEALWVRAKGRCEICRMPAEDTPGGRLCIDHDGRYGYFAVRGLLCRRCNALMGFIDRGEKQDRRAIAYCANAWFIGVLHERHQRVGRLGLVRSLCDAHAART